MKAVMKTYVKMEQLATCMLVTTFVFVLLGIMELFAVKVNNSTIQLIYV